MTDDSGLIISPSTSIGRSFPSSSSLSLDTIIGIWLNEKFLHSRSEKTLRLYRDTLHGFRMFVEASGLTLIPETPLAGDELEEWQMHMTVAVQLYGQTSVRKAAISNATYNNRLAVLSSFYTCVAKKRFSRCGNPVEWCDRLRVQPFQGVKWLTEDEVQRVMVPLNQKSPKSRKDARACAMLNILLLTGRRMMEVGTLQWKHCEPRAHSMILHFEHCKGGKKMVDEVPEIVAASILEWLTLAYPTPLTELDGEVPLWFSFSAPSKNGFLQPSSISAIVYEYFGFTQVHKTRHTWARTMLDAGADVETIRERLGHSSLATTGEYLKALTRAENKFTTSLLQRYGLHTS